METTAATSIMMRFELLSYNDESEIDFYLVITRYQATHVGKSCCCFFLLLEVIVVI